MALEVMLSTRVCVMGILQTQAVNNASFLSPDEDGCQFMYQYIEAEFPYNEKILSKINIDAVIGISNLKGVSQLVFQRGCLRRVCMSKSPAMPVDSFATTFTFVPCVKQSY